MTRPSARPGWPDGSFALGAVAYGAGQPDVAWHAAVECYVAVHVLDGDIRGVDEQVEVQVGLDRVADVLRFVAMAGPPE
jgi:hypothetical protein